VTYVQRTNSYQWFRCIDRFITPVEIEQVNFASRLASFIATTIYSQINEAFGNDYIELDHHEAMKHLMVPRGLDLEKMPSFETLSIEKELTLPSLNTSPQPGNNFGPFPVTFENTNDQKNNGHQEAQNLHSGPTARTDLDAISKMTNLNHPPSSKNSNPKPGDKRDDDRRDRSPRSRESRYRKRRRQDDYYSYSDEDYYSEDENRNQRFHGHHRRDNNRSHRKDRRSGSFDSDVLRDRDYDTVQKD